MARVIMILGLAAFVAVLINNSVRLTLQARKQQQSVSQLHVMKLAKDYLIALSVDVDNDGKNELLLPGAGNVLPPSIQARINEVSGSGYSTQIMYCAGSANASDAVYATNAGAYLPPSPIGKLVSPGSNNSFETTCNDTEAKGDDVMLTIIQTEIQATPKEIGGFVKISSTGTDSGIKTIVKNNNVVWINNLVTIGNFDVLPTTDPNGNAIRPGTIAYVPPQGTEKAKFANYDGTEWKKYDLN